MRRGRRPIPSALITTQGRILAIAAPRVGLRSTRQISPRVGSGRMLIDLLAVQGCEGSQLPFFHRLGEVRLIQRRRAFSLLGKATVAFHTGGLRTAPEVVCRASPSITARTYSCSVTPFCRARASNRRFSCSVRSSLSSRVDV